MTLLRRSLHELRDASGEKELPPLAHPNASQSSSFTPRTMTKGVRLPGAPVPSHTWAVLGGLWIAGDSWGDPTWPTVVLLHGVGQNRQAWGRAGTRLSEAGYHVVAYDARGHGDSDWAIDGDYSRDAMIRDLQCLLATLGSKPVALVGAAMGGGVSLLAAAEGHVDTTALVLVDVALRAPSARRARIKSTMIRSAEGLESVDDGDEEGGRYDRPVRRGRKLDSVTRNVRLGGDGNLHWHWDPRLDAREPDVCERRLAAARRLTLPTLLVSGSHTDSLNEDGVTDFLASCPHCEHVAIAAGGDRHSGHHEDPFVQAVLEFLRRNVAVGHEFGQIRLRSPA